MTLSSHKNVFIVIPVHNRKDLTRLFLLSLRRQTFQRFRIIVIDDGSSDGTAELIEAEFPEVVLLKGDGNLWWTGATNLGVEYTLAHTEHVDYVLTLNNDTAVRSNYIEILLNAASECPQSLIGSLSVSDEDESMVVDAGVRINWLTAKYTNYAGCGSYNDLLNNGPLLREVDVLPGRGTLIPLELFRKIGLYESRHLPHYGADYEFSHRAHANGYKLLINHAAVVVSHVTATGLNNRLNKLDFSDFLKSFFSIRSANNLRCRWNFARLCVRGWKLPIFFGCDIGRVILGALLNQSGFRNRS